MFDGHGGEAIANYVHTHMIDHLFAADTFSASDSEWATRSVEAVRCAFTTLDTAVLAKANDDPVEHFLVPFAVLIKITQKIPGGSTAAVAIVRRWPVEMNKRPHVTVAWCGDSRVLLVGSDTAITLTAPVCMLDERKRHSLYRHTPQLRNPNASVLSAMAVVCW